MKINSASQCLSLVLKSLDTVIAPELTSNHAKDTLDQIKITLMDLLKRQGPLIEVLRKCINDGDVLYRTVLEYLDEGKAVEISCAHADVKGFEALAEYHGDLTERLNKLARKLLEAASKDTKAIQLVRQIAEWEASYYNQLHQVQARPFGDNPAVPPATLNSESPLSRESLEKFLNSRRGPLEITDFSHLPGGFGKQTYMATVKHSDGSTEDLVIRKQDPVPIILHRSFLLEQEYDMLCAVSKAGYLCPRPIDLALNPPGVDGTFFTMTRTPGKVPGSFLKGHEAKIPEEIFLQTAELLAQLHSLPMDVFTDYISRYDEPAAVHETIEDRYRRNLKSYRNYLAQVEHLPSPLITWMFDWLERNIPKDNRRPVLTHGDFNVHNMLAEGNRITGVLDWECADFGAPEQDVAWYQPHISKHMDFNKWLAHYHACGGQKLESSHMAFYGVWSMMRPLLAGVRSTYNLQHGRNRDLRYVMVEQGFAPAFMQMALNLAASDSKAAEKVIQAPHLEESELIGNDAFGSGHDFNEGKAVLEEISAA